MTTKQESELGFEDVDKNVSDLKRSFGKQKICFMDTSREFVNYIFCSYPNNSNQLRSHSLYVLELVNKSMYELVHSFLFSI